MSPISSSRRYLDAMTAAHAHEYELPPRAPVPAEAVTAAEGGQVVYLTRGGKRVARVTPPDEDLRLLEEAARLAEQHEAEVGEELDLIRRACAEPHYEPVRRLVLPYLERRLRDAEDAADLAAGRLELARRDAGEEAIPAEQLWAELGL
jgi:antitoxin (DNA-binding transcriptional repressor) of toxin-antitoxin stability system